MEKFKDFLAAYDGCLKKAQPALVKILLPYATRKPKKDELFARLELWTMNGLDLTWNAFIKGANTRGHATLREGNQISHEKLAPAAEKLWSTALPDNISEKDGPALTKAAEALILGWFEDGWKQAGGADAKLPTYYSVEDDFQFKDFATGKVFGSEEKVAKHLGYTVEADAYLPPPATKEDDDEYLAAELEKLNKGRPRIVEYLSGFISREPLPDMVFAVFKIDDYRDYALDWLGAFRAKDNAGHPILEFAALDGTNGESFLPEIAEMHAERFGTRITSNDHELGFGQRQDAQILAYFKRCWMEAGGSSSKIPTYVCLGNDPHCQDILSGEKLTEILTAARHGYKVHEP